SAKAVAWSGWSATSPTCANASPPSCTSRNGVAAPRCAPSTSDRFAPMVNAVDPSFLDLPFRTLSEAALGRAGELGVSHADFRFERVRYQQLAVSDGML